MTDAPPATVGAVERAEPRTARRERTLGREIGLYVGRSLLPLATLAVIAGTLLFGPWVCLVLAFVLWRLGGRLA